MRSRISFARVAQCLVVICLLSGVGNSYSVLTHEEVIDLLWNKQLRPMLLLRFPGASQEELRQAHGYAYGGSVIPDMGYYPLGNKYFSDLVHYVRSGDLVSTLIRESSNLDEYAFALGVLAHYASDNSGHPTINRVVAMEFPRLRRKYGAEVTYEDDPKAHIRTEFGFDMEQVAKNRYTPDQYRDFIGFYVSKPLLERAFLTTYGVKLQEVLPNEDLAIGTFRRAISKVIPEMTRVALLSQRKEIVQDSPSFNEKKFLYRLSNADYEKRWDNEYQKPGFGARFLAIIFKIVPKVGPFKALAFKVPTTATEDMYIKSINRTFDDYNRLLREQEQGHLSLVNLNFDTGRETREGDYSLADKTYARLLDDLAKRGFDNVPADLRENILDFYSSRPQTVATAKKQKTWQNTLREVEQLRTITPAPSAE
jgi:hypothetical protein